MAVKARDRIALRNSGKNGTIEFDGTSFIMKDADGTTVGSFDATAVAVTLSAIQTITGVKTMSGANVITHANTGLKVQESGAGFNVTIAPGAESADRTLSIPVLGAADILETLGTAQTITGIKSFSTMFRIKRSAVVAAAGSAQGDAAALSEGFQTVSGANGTLGVRLPTAVAGAVVIIKGVTAGVLKVYPATGAAINAIAADGAMSLASGAVPAIFIADSTTQWYTLPLLPS